MVFISYSSKDRDLALRIREFLADRGIDSWLDNKAIQGGDDFAEEIVKALSPCDFYLLLVSEAAQESIWVPKELVLAFNLRKTIIPVHIDRSAVRDTFMFYFSNVQMIEYAGRESAALEDLLRRLTSKAAPAVRSRQISVIRSKPAMDLSRFTGREAELAFIDEQIRADNDPVCLTGMGGIGKSMLVQKYVRDHDDEFVSAYAVYDVNLLHTIAGMHFANETRQEGEKEIDVFAKHLDWLEAYGKSLVLIIDNFDGEGYTKSFDELLAVPCAENLTNFDILKRLAGNIHVLVTTRTEPENGKELPLMAEDELLALAKKIGIKIKWTAEAEASMKAIIRMVGRHTMIVALIAAAVNRSLKKDVSQMEALIRSEEYSRSRDRVSARDYRADARDAVFDAHMRVVFHFENFDGTEKDLLRILSLVPVTGIGLALFSGLAEETFGEEALEEKLVLFRDLHMIAVEEERITVHPLLAHYLREELRPEYENCKGVIDRVLRYYDPQKAHSDYEALGEIAALEESAAERISDERKQAELWDDAAGIYHRLASYERSLAAYRKALSIRERVLPADHPSIAVSYNNIGVTLGALGRHEEALENYEKALSIWERVLPADHPDIAVSYNNIGATLDDLGRHGEALENKKKALSILERVLPSDHPSIAGSYDNIGVTLGALGRHGEALENFEKALSILERVLPADHPDIAGSYNNIGAALDDLGRHGEALENKKKALSIRERVLPSDHPDIAASYDNIGITLGALGRHEEALENYEKALSIRERVLPSDHPDIARSYINIGAALGALGRYGEALENYEKALSILERVLPADHPDIAKSYNNIGAALGALGRHEEALVNQKKALSIRGRVLPADHPSIASSYNNIGAVLGYLGRHEEALEYYQKALEIFTRSLPAGHPYFKVVYRGLVREYDALDDYENAEKYRKLSGLGKLPRARKKTGFFERLFGKK